ncbi:hypothetical protein SARC_10149 [Sphaeroforma arctica JP610]|uniref:Flavin-containing monooxygenase n=1 Tax=Sphaeroforma arctica JP610 TaxID=667725 RepID=A0A0L0FLN2_9EUKA|nr:hypothetical protein SARC_10149 [Sphaeroforma arctica JP610]KNC77391.1 hypothetical protein SARC_10149 [Sphaeroforma arctica JP610]|eukprot:XP_014151293.1 hypothetical protein SARC_10149 [Sphaeroforma arctica JP610]
MSRQRYEAVQAGLSDHINEHHGLNGSQDKDSAINSHNEADHNTHTPNHSSVDLQDLTSDLGDPYHFSEFDGGASNGESRRSSQTRHNASSGYGERNGGSHGSLDIPTSTGDYLHTQRSQSHTDLSGSGEFGSHHTSRTSQANHTAGRSYASDRDSRNGAVKHSTNITIDTASTRTDHRSNGIIHKENDGSSGSAYRSPPEFVSQSLPRLSAFGSPASSSVPGIIVPNSHQTSGLGDSLALQSRRLPISSPLSRNGISHSPRVGEPESGSLWATRSNSDYASLAERGEEGDNTYTYDKVDITIQRFLPVDIGTQTPPQTQPQIQIQTHPQAQLQTQTRTTHGRLHENNRLDSGGAGGLMQHAMIHSHSDSDALYKHAATARAAKLATCTSDSHHLHEDGNTQAEHKRGGNDSTSGMGSTIVNKDTGTDSQGTMEPSYAGASGSSRSADADPGQLEWAGHDTVVSQQPQQQQQQQQVDGANDANTHTPLRSDAEDMVFDRVVVCSGVFSKEHIPEIEGLHSFRGISIHSRAYDTAYPLFYKKKVLVVGSGSSGVDIALEAYQVAKETRMSVRRDGIWLQRRFFHGRPYDIFASRFLAYLPCVVRNLVSFATAKHVLNASDYNTDAPQGNRRSSQWEMMANYTPDSGLGALIMAGHIKLCPAIARVSERRVFFVDGTSYDCDVIVFCTGYLPDLTLMPDTLVDRVDVLDDTATPKRVPLLHEFVWPPKTPGLAYVGACHVYGSSFPVFEMQARWVAYVFSGKVPLGPPEQLAKAARDEAQYVVMSDAGVRDLVNPIIYQDRISRLLGAYPFGLNSRLKDMLLWPYLYLSTCTSWHYRLVGRDSFSTADEPHWAATVVNARRRVKNVFLYAGVGLALIVLTRKGLRLGINR